MTNCEYKHLNIYYVAASCFLILTQILTRLMMCVFLLMVSSQHINEQLLYKETALT